MSNRPWREQEMYGLFLGRASTNLNVFPSKLAREKKVLSAVLFYSKCRSFGLLITKHIICYKLSSEYIFSSPKWQNSAIEQLDEASTGHLMFEVIAWSLIAWAIAQKIYGQQETYYEYISYIIFWLSSDGSSKTRTLGIWQV